ncbi:DUF6318 family protein [Cellulomonas cellasea]|uniref:DUF6318 domain-containing protein n=1 Tax=Cellulomonas cellasea TaxID=43670 RepID=A0A7W4UIQ8_9CELL|nr:DUF6318 family protein [Cellulomonas cellasea]MBB2924921.1 hypothetical protein [Cellulomonas cellasea]
MPLPRAADDARRPARRRRLAGASYGGAIGALALSMLTSCSGEPAAEPTPTSTASASPTADPTPTPTTTPEPERPAAMDDPGVDGAVAAATYFLSLYPYVYNTGDLTAWKALSHPECVFCASVVTNVEAMHAKGNHQEGTDTTVSSARAQEIEPGALYAVDMTVSQGPAVELDRNGAVVEEDPSTTESVMHVAVQRAGSVWVIRECEVESVA